VIRIDRLDDLSALGQPLHLAAGVFDGFHVGHQAVIARAVAAARAQGGLAGLLTFDPHPIRVIAPEQAPAPILIDAEHRERLAASLGIELMVVLRFDRDMAAMEADEFLKHLTAAPLHTLAVGEDWRFGRGRVGDVAMLEAASHVGFQLEAVPRVLVDGVRVSSTRIREALQSGDLAAASRLLGRRYSIGGTVMRGDRVGHQLGFPTANLIVDGMQTPPDGVWVVEVDDGSGVRRDGVANLGTRPTVAGVRGEKRLEVHLFETDADLYGRFLEVWPMHHLRPERRFDDLESLRCQIAADVRSAKHHIDSHRARTG
jgi:riboflavin kinase/FMN adenylyltransferase